MSQLISYWPLLIILLIGIIIALIHTPVTFTIVFTQVNSYTRIRVSAQALNKLVNIGLRDLYKAKTNENTESLVNETGKMNPLFSMPTISESIQFFHRLKKRHLRRMACDSLIWETQVGVNDPMGSALISGSLWGIKYWLLGLLQSKFIYRQAPQINVQPMYHHAHFNTELKCVLKIKLRQALSISILLVWHLSKSRREKQKLEKLTSQYI